MSDTTNKKPIEKVTQYPVTAAIWRNISRDGSAFHSVTFERSYRDDNGDWKNTSSFREIDLLLLAKAADLAHTKIAELKAQERQSMLVETEEPSDQGSLD